MQVWHAVRVAAAAVFVCFAIVHSHKVFVSLAPGLVVFGVDAAHRWLQARHEVSIHVSATDGLVSIVVPLEVRGCIHAQLQ